LGPGDTTWPISAEQRVDIVASMPCYSAANVDKQRGDGVVDLSIAALRLNGYGAGKSGSDLSLNLVYNPRAPSLPPDQQALQGRPQA
jgi:hypothetical protein